MGFEMIMHRLDFPVSPVETMNRQQIEEVRLDQDQAVDPDLERQRSLHCDRGTEGMADQANRTFDRGSNRLNQCRLIGQ